MVIAVSTLVVHMLIVYKLYFIPESLAIVILGEFLLFITKFLFKSAAMHGEARIELFISFILEACLIPRFMVFIREWY